MTIRVLIADDHPVFRHGLCAALADATDITVVGEATDGDAAVKAAVDLTADVVLMGLNMPGRGGIEANRTLARAAPGVAVLVLTMFDNDESLFTAMRAGARGYLVKGAEQERIVRAIQGSPPVRWYSVPGRLARRPQTAAGFADFASAGRAGRRRAALVDQMHGDPGQGGLGAPRRRRHRLTSSTQAHTSPAERSNPKQRRR
jgi:CheY-like chemotaxis protein